MAKLTVAQKNEIIKNAVVSQVGFLENFDNVEQVGDFTFAFSCTVDDEERWAEVNIVAKNNKDTATSNAYDPFEKAQEWKEEKEIKAKEKGIADKKKAEKISKAKAKAKKSETDGK